MARVVGFTSCILAALAAGCVLRFDVGALPAGDAGAAHDEGARAPAVDLLFVVDNSGSMCDDQAALVRAFFDEDCPIQDLDDVPAELLRPSPDEADALDDECGLAQMLAAYGLDFRVGVITTDVGPCDNRFEQAGNAQLSCRIEPGWGRRAQRGCLQAPDGVERKFLTPHDSAIATRFRALIGSAGVFGSAFERGLDAVDVFLDPASERAAGCEGDAAAFLRPGAHLVVVFVSDEDDCSHADGSWGFADESAGESCAHEREQWPLEREPPVVVEDCHERPELLAPVEGYAARWRAATGGRISAVLLGGVLDDDQGVPYASACLATSDGAATAECTVSYGSSSFTAPGAMCDPSVVDLPCCQADAAPRYLELIERLGEHGAAGSLCTSSLRGELKHVLGVVF